MLALSSSLCVRLPENRVADCMPQTPANSLVDSTMPEPLPRRWFPRCGLHMLLLMSGSKDHYSGTPVGRAGLGARPRSRPHKGFAAFHRDDADYLARLAWRADGCPANLWAQYRREVEIQLMATRRLLEAECHGGSFHGAKLRGKALSA